MSDTTFNSVELLTVLYSFILTTLKSILCVQRGFSYSENSVKKSDFTTLLPKFIKLLYSRNSKRTYLKRCGDNDITVPNI